MMKQLPQPFRANRFVFTIARAEMKNFEASVLSTAIPGISMGESNTPSRNREGFVPGDRITYSSLSAVFMVDSELTNYSEIYKWMMLNRDGGPVVSDAEFILYSAKNNPTISIKLIGLFPTDLTELGLNAQSAVDQVNCTVTFKFDRFELSTGAGSEVSH